MFVGLRKVCQPPLASSILDGLNRSCSLKLSVLVVRICLQASKKSTDTRLLFYRILFSSKLIRKVFLLLLDGEDVNRIAQLLPHPLCSWDSGLHRVHHVCHGVVHLVRWNSCWTHKTLQVSNYVDTKDSFWYLLFWGPRCSRWSVQE